MHLCTGFGLIPLLSSAFCGVKISLVVPCFQVHLGQAVSFDNYSGKHVHRGYSQVCNTTQRFQL